MSPFRPIKLAAVLTVLAFSATSQSANLLKNPSFETPFGTADPVWRVDLPVAAHGTIQFSKTQVHSGKAGLVLIPNSQNTSSLRTASGFGVAQLVPPTGMKGHSLYVAGWLKADPGSVAVLRIYAVSSDGRVAFHEMRQQSGSRGLVFHRDIYNVAPDFPLAFAFVACLVEGTSGAAYFDDITLSVGTPGSWLEANGTPDPGIPLEATVSVQPDQVLRHIPSTLYGTNLEWVWNGNGIWNPASGAIDHSLLALSRQLGSTLFRFPGGIYSDFYHWQAGIGPQSQRPSVQSIPDGPVDVDHFGTDEALAFAQLNGGNLLITVNVITGTPQEAADWVRYVNGNGRRVTYWELGNESYAGGSTSAVAYSMMSPEVYAQRVIDFATAMRAVDPGIKIGAIADENYSRTVPRSFPDWTSRVLAIAGNYIDFLAVHCAYAPALSTDEGWNARTVYSAMLAAPQEILAQLNDLSKRISAAVPARAGQIRIAVTEWGPYFDYRPTSRFVDHPKTVASGVYAASALAAMIQSQQTDIANYFKLVDANFIGAIGVRQNDFAAKSTFYSLQLFSQHFGTELVATSTVGPAYDSPTVGWVDAQSAVPYLDVVSSTSADSSRLYIMVINKHLDRQIHAVINTGSFIPSETAVAFTMSGTSPDANTGTGLVSIPGVTWAQQAEVAPYNRFYAGSNSEVGITSQTVTGVSQTFDYTFPPASVTSVMLTRK